MSNRTVLFFSHSHEHITCACLMSVYAVPGADISLWEEAEGAEEHVHRGKSDEASSGHEAGQRVQAEHPQAEEEGDEGAARSRRVGVRNNTPTDAHHSAVGWGGKKKLKFELVSRQCNQIHQKREEMAERIQEISNETQQLKAKIQSLRNVCSKETERAQVGPGCPPPKCSRVSTLGANAVSLHCAQALYDTLSTSMDELHRRIETHVTDLKCDVSKMSANFWTDHFTRSLYQCVFVCVCFHPSKLVLVSFFYFSTIKRLKHCILLKVNFTALLLANKSL